MNHFIPDLPNIRLCVCPGGSPGAFAHYIRTPQPSLLASLMAAEPSSMIVLACVLIFLGHHTT